MSVTCRHGSSVHLYMSHPHLLPASHESALRGDLHNQPTLYNKYPFALMLVDGPSPPSLVPRPVYRRAKLILRGRHDMGDILASISKKYSSERILYDFLSYNCFICLKVLFLSLICMYTVDSQNTPSKSRARGTPHGNFFLRLFQSYGNLVITKGLPHSSMPYHT